MAIVDREPFEEDGPGLSIDHLEKVVRESKDVKDMLQSPGGKILLQFLKAKVDAWTNTALYQKNEEDLLELWKETRRWNEIGNFLFGTVESGQIAEKAMMENNSLFDK
jgi:hypothetical protein